jgi:hypothetical protein
VSDTESSPARRTLLILVSLVLLWGALGLYLSIRLDWPAGYGVRCGGFCFPYELANSGLLLHRRSADELTLFAWLWSWPALAAFEMMYWVAGKIIGR